MNPQHINFFALALFLVFLSSCCSMPFVDCIMIQSKYSPEILSTKIHETVLHTNVIHVAHRNATNSDFELRVKFFVHNFGHDTLILNSNRLGFEYFVGEIPYSINRDFIGKPDPIFKFAPNSADTVRLRLMLTSKADIKNERRKNKRFVIHFYDHCFNIRNNIIYPFDIEFFKK